MQKKKLNSQGFGLYGILVTILVIAVVSGVGVYVFRHGHKAKRTSSVTANSQVSQGKTPTTQADPYAGWKSYSDSQTHYSFKYPATWALSATGTQVTVLNQDKTVEVDYVNPYVHDSGLLGFVPVSIDSITVGGKNMAVVGGVYTPANEPDYGVIDEGQLQTYPVTPGTATQFPNALRFTDLSDSSVAGAFRARYTSPFSSTSDAQAWFATADAKTSLLILKSLTYAK